MFIDFGRIITCYGMATTKIAPIKDFVELICSHQKNKDHFIRKLMGSQSFGCSYMAPTTWVFPLPKLERDPLSEVCFNFLSAHKS
jgi:hypothetical protein